ncbi:MAG TPA: hypothetical protein VJM33_18465 [Microthrixaceae bacterium]|nr:hypothetical protein [Microthrixaceae bacterium]
MTTNDEEFEVELRWRERVIYWEGSHGFEFEGAWGGAPRYTIVPNEQDWDEQVPPWMRGRRDEIVRRLDNYPAEEVTTEGYHDWGSPGAREHTRDV